MISERELEAIKARADKVLFINGKTYVGIELLICDDCELSWLGTYKNTIYHNGCSLMTYEENEQIRIVYRVTHTCEENIDHGKCCDYNSSWGCDRVGTSFDYEKYYLVFPL